MKKIILMMIMVLSVVLKPNIVFAEDIYKEYKIGDKITYNGINFYVVADSDKNKDYVTLLKETPLTVDEVNKYGKDENGVNYINKYTYDSNGIAYNINNTGYGGVAYYTSSTCGYYNDSGCAVEKAGLYESSDVKHVVDNWSKAVIDLDDLVEDKLGYKARLITINELISNLGFDWNINSYGDPIINDNVPDWVVINNLYYWTMDKYGDLNISVWIVNSESIGQGNIYSHTNLGDAPAVRPVINLKKEPISQKRNLTDKKFNTGDIVEYNNMRFYVLGNSSEKNKTVTLIKETPLTYDEVEKYGKGIVNLYAYKDYRNKVVDNNGYGGISYYTGKNCGYVDDSDNIDPINNGCTTSYYKSDIKKVVDAWAIDMLNEQDLARDTLGYKVRLISMSELMNNLGYGNDNGEGTIYMEKQKTPYDWVINVSSWYWTMATWGDSSSRVWIVGTGDTLHTRSVFLSKPYSDSEYVGGLIRPVITLKKQSDQKITDGDDIVRNENNNQIIKVPDTFLSKSITIVVAGLALIVFGGIISYLVIKKKKFTKNK